MGRERQKQITINATLRQFTRWESTAASFSGGMQGFLSLAADLFARYLRESSRERAKLDPIGQRLREKAVLGRLLSTAVAAVDHLPEHVDSFSHGRWYPKRDLQRAIESVRTYLRETGEEYGPLL